MSERILDFAEELPGLRSDTPSKTTNCESQFFLPKSQQEFYEFQISQLMSELEKSRSEV